jgi:hypothetical protein
VHIARSITGDSFGDERAVTTRATGSVTLFPAWFWDHASSDLASTPTVVPIEGYSAKVEGRQDIVVRVFAR